MTYQVYFTKQADTDIDEIIDYIAQDSLDNAFIFIDQLQRRITSTLSVMPLGGATCGDARYLSFGNYVVVYDVDESNKAVYVLLVMEGHKQWKVIFEERS